MEQEDKAHDTFDFFLSRFVSASCTYMGNWQRVAVYDRSIWQSEAGAAGLAWAGLQVMSSACLCLFCMSYLPCV
ncbi:hypothetical protein F5Y14DRAFT_400782 [Nemania sp. NC0429]|nr:hypothetical protein F5Y14DRAFT_400782 [Nemania sp. NC0429]